MTSKKLLVGFLSLVLLLVMGEAQASNYQGGTQSQIQSLLRLLSQISHTSLLGQVSCPGNPPTVSFSSLGNFVYPTTGMPVSFSLTGTDPEGGALQYAVDFSSDGGWTPYQTSAQFSKTFSWESGQLFVKAYAKDSCGNQSAPSELVFWPSNNPGSAIRGPVARLLGPTAISVQQMANLSAEAIDDISNANLTYTWSKYSGPGTVTFSNPNSPNTSATVSVAGSYRLKFKAHDGQISSSNIFVDVNFAQATSPSNQAPIAQASVTPTSATDTNGNGTEPFNFSSSGSNDPDGSIVSYSWKDNGQQISTQASPSNVLLSVDSHAITLTVTDNGGLSATSAAVNVTVYPGPCSGNQAPTAAISGPSSGQTGSPLNFSGTGSNDPGGSISGYAWNSTPSSGANIASPTSASTNITFTTAGTYSVRLTVTDNCGDTDLETKTVTITNPQVNQAPNVNAGADQTITLPTDTVTLNATVTDDGLPLGRLLSYAWTKESGPGTVNFSGPNTEDPQATFSLAGIYNLKLTVTEILNLVPVLSGFGTTQITVNAANPCVGNQPPVAAISGPSSGQTGSPLNFSGTGSTDPNGNNTIASYSWNFGNGQSSTAVSPSVTYVTAGTYQVTLTVTDSCGAIGETTRSVSISNPASNELPIADADPDYQSVTVGAPASFNGSASYDPDGSVVSYWWNFGDGSSTGWQTSPFAEHAYITTGSRTVTLWVKDNSGATSASNAVNVSVGDTDPCAGNTSPTANAGPDRTVVVNTPATFSSTGSTDSDGTITSYAWTFGDESSASGAVVSHIYTTAGTYTLKLIVTDNCEAAGQDTAVITVTNPPVGELNADFRVYRLVYVDPYTHEEEWAEVNLATEIVPIGTQLKFDSSASTGDIGFATWTLGDGTFETGTVVQHQYENGGTFPVELTIFDTTWQHYDTMTKSVTGAAVLTFLDSLGLADDNSNDIVLYNNLAWTSHLNGKINTINITNPADLVMVSSITAPSARAITYANNHLFLAGSTGGMHIYEATTPNPTSVGVYNTWSQDGQSVRDVYGQGKVVIMAAGPAGLKLLNVSSPGSPTVLGVTPLPNNTSAEVLLVSNGKAYVADGSTKVHIYDLSGLNFNNPSAFTPTLLKTINVGWIVHQLAITGNTLIAQANPGGMFLYDVTNPASATQIGYFDIADEAVGQSPGGIVASGHYVYAGFGPVLGIGTSVAKVSLVNPASPYIAEWLSLSALSVSGTNRSPVLRNGVLYFANSMHRAATVGVGE